MKTKENKLYTRHHMLKGWAQDLIKDSTVFMIGVGALGCEIAKNLALVGLGKMYLCDVDTIETSNLSRQMLFKPGDEGRGKAEVGAERLKELNPFMEVKDFNQLLQEIPMKYYQESDLIIGGLDNIRARLDLNDICLRLKKPLIDSGTLGYEGHVQIVIPSGIEGFEETPCLRCLMPIPPTDEKLIAACTPKGIPQKREHCALKAEYEFGKKYNRRPDFENDDDIAILVEYANKFVEEYKFPPKFKPQDMENVIKNKMPAIQTATAVIASIQSHEILKILHKLKGYDIGPIMFPPYINYNGFYGIFEQIEVAKWDECPACGKGIDLRRIEIESSAIILSLFDQLKYAGFDLDPDQTLISKELTKKVVWNPYVPKLKDPNKTIIESGIQDHDLLMCSVPNQESVRILVAFI
ncbi:MAG: ThiF family adenylyltransferase [Candidatus Hodarchaeota archaeon]